MVRWSSVILLYTSICTILSVANAKDEECGKQAGGVPCPLNVCCSQWGFCGVTSEFCDKAQNCQSNCGSSFSPANPYMYDVRETIIGYYETWAPHNPGCGSKPARNIPMTSLSHVNAAFGYIKPDSYVITPIEEATIDDFRAVTNLKGHSPGTKVWLSLGGWTFSDNGTTTQPVWGDLASTQEKRNRFIKELERFMVEWGFDGVDLDWEYPAAPDRRGHPDDTKNYLFLVQDIRASFDSRGLGWGLSFTAPSSYWYMKWFDIEGMAQEVDWINLMTYDLHGSWDNQSDWIGPHIYAHTNMTEIKDALQLLWRNNVPAEKVNLGLAFYGRSYTLKNPNCDKPGCEFIGKGTAGECSATPGYMSYQDIANIIENTGSKPVHDKETGAMYLRFDYDQWVSYDSPETLKEKVEFANKVGLRGLFIWAIDQDTDQYDLLQAVLDPYGLGHFANSSDDSDWTSYMASGCEWSQCGIPTCKPGQASVSSVRCGDPKGKIRKMLCCPLDGAPDPDFCQWRSGGLFLCDNLDSCHSDEVLITKDNYWVDTKGTDHSCLGFGKADYCCKKEEVGEQLCGWYDRTCIELGSDHKPKIPSAACPQGQQFVTYRRGPCDSVGKKVQPYCCSAGVDISKLSCHWKLGGPPNCAIGTCGQNEVNLGQHEGGNSQVCVIREVHPSRGPPGDPLENPNPTFVYPTLCCNKDALKINVKTLPVPLANLFFPEDLKDRPADDKQKFGVQVDDTMGGQEVSQGNSDPNANSFAWHIIDGPEKEVANLNKRDGSHWDVYDCDTKKHEGVQKAKMVCRDESKDSNCYKIWLGEVEATVLRMPDGCGPGKYAMAISLIPIEVPSKSVTSDNKNSTVYELTFDYDFSILQKRDSKVLLRIDYSDNPGYWKEIVAAPPGKTKRDVEIEVDQVHGGSWESYMDHAWSHEKCSTPEHELHLLHERWFSIGVDNWIQKMRHVETEYTALRHTVNKVFPLTLFDETKVCQIGPVTQTLHAKLEADLKVEIETSAQLTLIGYIGDLNSFKQSHLSFRNKGSVSALLNFEAFAELRFGSLNNELVGIAPLGASVFIPGIVTIGPQFKILGGLRGTINVHANAQFEVGVAEWDFTQNYPFEGTNTIDEETEAKAKGSARQGVANKTLGPEFNWDVSASGSVEVHITPQITFGIDFNPKFNVPNSAIDIGIDCYSRLYGNAGVSSNDKQLRYCYGMDAGYEAFARVTAPTLFGINLNRYWTIDSDEVPLLKSEANCRSGGASKRDLNIDVWPDMSFGEASEPPIAHFEKAGLSV